MNKNFTGAMSLLLEKGDVEREETANDVDAARGTSLMLQQRLQCLSLSATINDNDDATSTTIEVASTRGDFNATSMTMP